MSNKKAATLVARESSDNEVTTLVARESITNLPSRAELKATGGKKTSKSGGGKSSPLTDFVLEWFNNAKIGGELTVPLHFKFEDEQLKRYGGYAKTCKAFITNNLNRKVPTLKPLYGLIDIETWSDRNDVEYCFVIKIAEKQ